MYLWVRVCLSSWSHISMTVQHEIISSIHEVCLSKRNWYMTVNVKYSESINQHGRVECRFLLCFCAVSRTATCAIFLVPATLSSEAAPMTKWSTARPSCPAAPRRPTLCLPSRWPWAATAAPAGPTATSAHTGPVWTQWAAANQFDASTPTQTTTEPLSSRLFISAFWKECWMKTTVGNNNDYTVIPLVSLCFLRFILLASVVMQSSRCVASVLLRWALLSLNIYPSPCDSVRLPSACFTCKGCKLIKAELSK